jgi:hypothetical protein
VCFMGWWSDFRDNILKPVAGVVLLGNVLGGGQSNIFKSLFGGGTSAASTGSAVRCSAVQSHLQALRRHRHPDRFRLTRWTKHLH